MEIRILLLSTLIGYITISLVIAQPNFLVIIADDVDVESFEAYSTNPTNTSDGETIETPQIATLANEGIRFTNAYTTPLCTPTRTMLLTGQYSFRNYRAFGYLDNDQTTFANVLRDNGYTTAIAGKWQLSDPDGDIPITPTGTVAPNITPTVMQNDYGFDSYLLWQLNYTTSDKGSRFWEPKLETASADGLSSKIITTSPSDYGPDLFAQHLKDFMTEAVENNTPFLAYYAMALPHDPWVSTPNEIVAKNGDNEIYFDENIEYIDKLVGELVAHLDDPDGNPQTNDSIRENTLIIFTSDNGTSPRISLNNSERGTVRGDKGTASYDGTHVPFILNWGDKTASAVSSRMLDLSDVFPTLLEVAAITPPNNLILDGKPIINSSGNILLNKDIAYIYYDPKGRNFPAAEFAQNETYKLYRDGRFYKIISDKLEARNLQDTSLSAEAQVAYEQLSNYLKQIKTMDTDSSPIKPNSVMNFNYDWRFIYFGQYEGSSVSENEFDYNYDGISDLAVRAYGTDTKAPNHSFKPSYKLVKASGAFCLANIDHHYNGGESMIPNRYHAKNIEYKLESKESLNTVWADTEVSLVSNSSIYDNFGIVFSRFNTEIHRNSQ